jgi:glycosyltransferase involved in cell wall biosynthesis
VSDRDRGIGENAGAAAAITPDMRVSIDLSMQFDLLEWASRHSRGEVPDAAPYGLHKLTAHGIEARFRPALRNRAAAWAARKVRNRLGQIDVVPTAIDAVRRERRRADAVLCWDERNGIPAALLPGGPPVVSGAVWLTDPARVRPRVHRLAARALPRMGALFHFTQPTGPILERVWGLPKDSVRIVPLGVDAQFYRPQPPAAEPGVVVSVGDDRMRDHAQLVRVVDRVRRRGVPVRLELATLQDIDVPEHLGVLHHRRMEGAILDLYQRSSVVAIASKPAPAGSGLTVLLEAMACGRPVVITGNPGFEDYVQHGVTGLLVPPGDEEAFADAVASLLRDPAAAHEMGRAGRRSVEARFTTDLMAAELAAVLRSIR